MNIKRMTKSLTMILSAIILVITSTLVCLATDNRYTISEVNDMTLFLPDDMTAITRSSQSTDRYFSVFGLDYDATMKNFRSSDIYLQGMDSNADTTLTVTMTETSDSKGISNYNLLQNDELTQITENFLSQGEYSSCTPDNATNIVWLIFDTKVNHNGQTIKAYQANTVYDGMSINVTLQRNEGNVKASDYQTFYSIVSSVNFLKAESADSVMIFAIIVGAVIVIVLIIAIIILIKKLAKRIKKSKNDRIIEELSSKYTTRRNRYRDEEEIEPDYNEYNDFLGEAVSEDVAKQPEQEIVEETEEIEEVEETAEESTEEYELEEFEDESDFNNDEELVRMEAKKTKFIDSDDFFEEAPKKTMGVISSKDIKDAEDYDVIEEVEKKAIEVEKPTPKKGESVVKVLKTIGGSIKSFFVHCGYFCTNTSRMIKRRNAMKKRQKAEEERRQKARMKAARERQQRREIQDKGLVQVRRRDEQRRPDSRNGKNRR